MPDKGYIPRKRYPAAGSTTGLDRQEASVIRRILDKQTVDEQFNYDAIENDALWRYDFDAKGDLFVGIAPDRFSRLGVGTNFQRLMAKDTEASGTKWEDPADTWTGASLPTTDLRSGRLVYATNLSNPVFGSATDGRRLYIYDTALGWQLVHPIQYTLYMDVSHDIAGTGVPFTTIGVDFGLAPIACTVIVTIQGCVQLNSGAHSEAIANIIEYPSGTVKRRTCLYLPSASYLVARPTMVCSFHEEKAAASRVAYQLSFSAAPTDVRFIGQNESFFPQDAWMMRVEVF